MGKPTKATGGISEEIHERREGKYLTFSLAGEEYGIGILKVKEIIQAVREENLPIPEYAWDVHTKKGRYMGKTKKNFFPEGYRLLKPRVKGSFDDVVKRDPSSCQ